MNKNKRSVMTVIVGMMVFPVLLGIGFAMLLNSIQPEARGAVAVIVAVFVFLMVLFSRWAMVRVK